MKERIREIRKALGLTQAQMAEKLHLANNYIYLIETGKNPVSDKMIYRLVEAFNVNEEWLRTGVGVMFNPIDRETEIADLVKDLLENEDTDYILEVTRLMQRMTLEDKELFIKIGNRFIQETKDHPN